MRSILARTDALKAINQAEAKLAAGDYAAILMDIQMPVMDGVEATRLIRSSDRLGAKARIPIVAVTAYAMAGDRERILASGMNDYATKPLDWKTLAGMINGLWGNVETGRPVSGEGSKPD